MLSDPNTVSEIAEAVAKPNSDTTALETRWNELESCCGAHPFSTYSSARLRLESLGSNVSCDACLFDLCFLTVLHSRNGRVS